MSTELSKSISRENVRAKKKKNEENINSIRSVFYWHLSLPHRTKNKVYSGQKKLAVLHSVPGNIVILQGEVSHLYLRAPSIGLVPPLQQPGSQIENLTFKCFQLPAVFFLALYSYRNLNIQNPCVTHFKSSKMDLTYTNQSRERCQRNLSTQNCIENDCNTPQTFTTCFPASVFY